jgi:hypothetical protein
MCKTSTLTSLQTKDQPELSSSVGFKNFPLPQISLEYEPLCLPEIFISSHRRLWLGDNSLLRVPQRRRRNSTSVGSWSPSRCIDSCSQCSWPERTRRMLQPHWARTLGVLRAASGRPTVWGRDRVRRNLAYHWERKRAEVGEKGCRRISFILHTRGNWTTPSPVTHFPPNTHLLPQHSHLHPSRILES